MKMLAILVAAGMMTWATTTAQAEELEQPFENSTNQGNQTGQLTVKTQQSPTSVQTESQPVSSVRVASLSILPKRWDKEANTKKIEQMVRQAVDQGAQLVITPEGVLEGYVIEEILREKNNAKKQKLNRRFHELAEPIDGRYIQHFQKFRKFRKSKI